jgi:hypothetical protein
MGVTMRRTSLRTAVSIAEIISALAVVVSLVYVANEFRRSRALTSTDVQTILYERVQEMERLVVESAELADIIVRASGDPESLSPADRARFLAFEHIFYDSWELGWISHEEGVLGPAGWSTWNDWFAEEARRRPRFGWTENRKHFDDDFLRYVDDALQRE